jgi:hypothetical protein
MIEPGWIQHPKVAGLISSTIITMLFWFGMSLVSGFHSKKGDCQQQNIWPPLRVFIKYPNINRLIPSDNFVKVSPLNFALLITHPLAKLP